MNKLKKIIFVILSIITIVAFANFSFASTITNTPKNNTTENDTDNVANESNTSLNEITTNNTASPINTSNSTENLPNTGIDSTNLNLALILLLAVVFGMFSLVQYNKIVKKEDD